MYFNNIPCVLLSIRLRTVETSAETPVSVAPVSVAPVSAAPVSAASVPAWKVRGFWGVNLRLEFLALEDLPPAAELKISWGSPHASLLPQVAVS